MKQMTTLIKVSDTTLKRYENFDLLPEVKKTVGGQRRYQEIHRQAFLTIRKLLQGFEITTAYALMRLAKAGAFSESYWLIAHSQKQLVADEEALQRNRTFILSLPQEQLPQQRLRIGELAKLAQVETSAIRYWEERGLITSQRGENGYRYYEEKEIKKTLIVTSLRKTIYAIEEIKKLLANKEPETIQKLKHHFLETKVKIDEKLAKQLEGIAAFMVYCEMLKKAQAE
ncbi:MerR family transcriptional regulator [Enterococcus massiliensis]|uniref:MerR family transcriptional regulator n=1 Tax=Enterococcus massiliensis TaxID=1640685 RepID=UPI00065DE07F|nr:MerR family transcriptional regulator [Enterococcus massiliensis]